MGMRGAIVPLAVVLALVSGVVLAETRRVVLVPAVTLDGDPAAGTNEGVIRRFYAAVNELLATGQEGPLDEVVDAELVEHPAPPGVTPDRTGFVRALRALRATAPTSRLTVLDVVAQGDRVAARVAIAGAEGAAFLGRPLEGDRLWGGVDVFRVAAGRVVEHWRGAMDAALLEPLFTVTIPVAYTVRQVVTFERWTFAPDALEIQGTDWGMLVLFVDTGALTVGLSGEGGEAARLAPGARGGSTAGAWVVTGDGDRRLGAGDALVIPTLTRVTLRNDGPIPAVALAVKFSTPVPQWRPEGAGSAVKMTGDVSQEELAGGFTAVLPAGGVTIALGRAVLAPGAALPPRRVDVVELAAVAAGEADVTADGGAAWVTTGTGAGWRLGEAGTLAAGDGAHFDPGSAVGYRARGDSPLELLLVMIAAAAEPATPMA
jgi:predicted ester cyclase